MKPFRKPVYKEIANIMTGESILRTFVTKTTQ
jgi:hypothetical protein